MECTVVVFGQVVVSLMLVLVGGVLILQGIGGGVRSVRGPTAVSVCQ